MATRPITMDELTRAFGRPMDPTVIRVDPIVQQSVAPQRQAAAPSGLLTAQPSQAAPRQSGGGLLGSIFGEKGSEERLRLKMGLMGLTHRPNQQLMAQWSNDLANMRDERKAAAATNKTAQYLRSLGTAQSMKAAEALEAGMIDAQTAYQMATQPEDPWAGVKVIGENAYRMGPNGAESILGGPDGAGLSSDQLSGLNTIRDDLRTEMAPFEIVKQGFNNISTFYANPGSVSDYALAVAFAKILDPGSVAREGEVAAVQSAGAKVPALGQALKNAITGEGQLTPETRNQIATLSAEIYNERASEAQAKIATFEEMARRAGLPTDLVYTGSEIKPGERPAPIIAPPVPAELGISQEDWQLDWDAMTEAERKQFMQGGR